MRALSVVFLTFSLALGGLACDLPWVKTPDPVPASLPERPEGWESLEDEDSAIRLYYQFVDAERRVRFVERLEDVPAEQRATVGFVKMEMPPPLSPADAARARRAQLAGTQPSAGAASTGSTRVVLYSADWCKACRKAKRYLSQRGVDFEERNIDARLYADELLRKTGRRAVPVIEVGGRILAGFSASSYDALLESI